MFSRSRFSRLLPDEAASAAHIELVGCGGVGSWTLALLRRMGLLRYELIDRDHVDGNNLATQAFVGTDEGQSKVDAAMGIIRAVGRATRVDTIQTDITEPSWNPSQLANVRIVAVDNMEARRLYFAKLARQGGSLQPCLYVDPRMSFEYFEGWFLNLPQEHSLAGYSEYLNDASRKYIEEPCGARAIAYTGAFAASCIASVIRRYLIGVPFPFCVRGDVGGFTVSTSWRDGEEYHDELGTLTEGDPDENEQRSTQENPTQDRDVDAASAVGSVDDATQR